VFLIPAKLSGCDIHQRLRAWEGVNLPKEDGYKRLLHALRSPYGPPTGSVGGLVLQFRPFVRDNWAYSRSTGADRWGNHRRSALKWEKQLS